MQNYRSPGADRVSAEMLKAEEDETPALLLTKILTDIWGSKETPALLLTKILTDIWESKETPALLLTKILTDIWESKETPKEWKLGLIIKIQKKGDLSNCTNWRGIALLPLTSKVFSRMLLCRMKEALWNTLRQEHAGFRKGKSCPDQIFTLRQILEQSAEWNATIYANFIDFEKAFDRLHSDALWKTMHHYGIPTKLVQVTRLLYTNSSYVVICVQVITDHFEVTAGVKQGCILSPFLFNLLGS